MDPASVVAAKYGIDASVVARHVERAKRSMSPKTDVFEVTEGGCVESVKIMREGVGPLDTPYGPFEHFSFKVSDPWQKYSALVCAPLDDRLSPVFELDEPIVLRIDSGCETGQLFGDRTCECKDQLEKALEEIAKSGQGLLINIPRQDGRGMGLPFKLATLYLQTELGVDTVESGSLLEPDGSRDIRTYSGAIAVLKFFDIPQSARLALASNNPKKLSIFGENGFTSIDMTGCVIPPTELTRHHLAAKQEHLGHINLVDESVPGGPEAC